MRRSILTPFRVGVVMLLGIAAFFYVLSIIGREQYAEEETYQLWAVFDDATGLSVKSRVSIAGIEVGIIHAIELTPESQARVTLRLKRDVAVRKDARLVKRSASLLGDFVIDLYPGTPGQPTLGSGDRIERVVMPPGAEAVFASLNDVAQDVKAMTKSLSDLLASDQGVGSIRETIDTLNDLSKSLTQTVEASGGRLDAILEDVQVLSGDIRDLARQQQPQVEQIVGNIAEFTELANRLAGTLEKIVGSGEADLKSGVASVRQTLDEAQLAIRSAREMLDSGKLAVDDVRSTMQKAADGQGALGRLLVDDTLVRSLERTAKDIEKLVAPVGEVDTQVWVRTEQHLWAMTQRDGKPSGKLVAGLKLQARPDHWYGVELVGDPRGNIRSETIRRTAADGTVLSEEQVITEDQALKISAYFGHRWGPGALRLGLIEGTGGFGGDLWLWNDALKLTVDTFELGRIDKPLPRLRAFAQLHLADHLFLGGGIDDALNDPLLANGILRTGRDFFVHAGLQFNDDDLKTILAIVGIPGAGK